MNRFSVFALRVLLVFLTLGCLFAQLWLVPQLAGDAARSAPELVYPAAPYTVLWIVLAGAAGVLLMIVMRGLLRSATSLQSELDEVV